MLRRTLAMVAIVVGLAALTCGCAPRYELRIESGADSLTGAQAERLAATTDIAALASVNATDAVAMRAQVLTDMRTRGQLAQRAADLLTVGFPERAAAVPVLVRGCIVDGADAVVVVEAFASEGGNLTHRRLWVFDRASGAILRAASFR